MGGFAYYKRVNALKELLVAGDAFDATCWRLLLGTIDLREEKERFCKALRGPSHVTCTCGEGLLSRLGGGGERGGVDGGLAGGECDGWSEER